MHSVFPWQQEIWNTLISSVEQKRFPHAILLCGNDGLGKSVLALQLAQYLLCSNSTKSQQPCQTCIDCILFSAKTHGDFYSVLSTEKSKIIGIDEIRKVKIAAQQKPQRNQIKVFIIYHADTMTIAAENALLKILEEPPGESIFILTSARKHLLPLTILSRCHSYGLTTLSFEKTAQWLLSQATSVLAQEEITAALTWSFGAPLLAQQLLNSDLIKEYQACTTPLLAFFSGQTSLLSLAQSWQGKSLANIIYVSQVACYYLLRGEWPYNFNKKLVYQWSRKIIDLKKNLATGIALNEALQLDFLLAPGHSS